MSAIGVAVHLHEEVQEGHVGDHGEPPREPVPVTRVQRIQRRPRAPRAQTQQVDAELSEGRSTREHTGARERGEKE